MAQKKKRRKKKRDPDKIYKIFTLIIGILLVLATAISITETTSLRNSLVGYVASPDNSMYNYCYDSDGGRNYYEKGTCFDAGGRSWTDKCQFGRKLVEYYCAPFYKTMCVSETIECECSPEKDVCLS